MEKTKLMLVVEQKLNEELENYLFIKYNEEFWTSTYIGRLMGIPAGTVRRWLPKFNIKLRNQEDYLARRIIRPAKGALKYCYNYLRIPVKQIAKERKVHPKTVYRWMEKEGIARRHGTEAYLKNGLKKPADEELKELCQEMKRFEIASIYNVWPETVDRWKQKIGLYTTEKSKYDSKKVRRKRLEEIINKTGKQIDELRLVDFYIKQLNGKSYRGLLWWYTAHYGYDLSQTRKHLIKEFVK